MYRTGIGGSIGKANAHANERRVRFALAAMEPVHEEEASNSFDVR